ncbi:MAG: hypothetical protein ACP5U2_05130 [Bryobacteraceae bacterium]
MTLTVVLTAYAASLVLALWLLYRYHAPWYWHVLAVVAALGIGLIPTPAPFVGSRVFDMVVGSLFVFLTAWGWGEIFLHRHHRRGGSR